MKVLNGNKDRSKADVLLDEFFAGQRLSLRECYIVLTGDHGVSGEFARCDPARMREHFGAAFVEALDSTSWAVALGNAIERRVHAEIDDMPELQAWRKIARPVPVKSFRPQHGTRIGGYPNLPAVAEQGAYAALDSPGDDNASYSLSKRGGTESITLEMLANDDAGAVRRVPAELARSAAMTLYEFVFDFLRTNPLIYDGVALFDATHGNLGAAALDTSAYFAAATAIGKQTRPGSGKRIGFGRKYLVVPLDLQEAAFTAFVSGQREVSQASALLPEVLPVPYWTDANDWCVVNDPQYCPTIEIGFLNGREAPEIITADAPSDGSLFSHDKIIYKIRHAYGGTVLDYRGMYKNAVV